MSNHLAIATVTAALEEMIQEALNRDVNGANVRVGRPDNTLGQNNKKEANLFLYQVTPNAALRNSHLPTRGIGGRLSSKPMVALDLHYLFSFYGDSKAFEPERMLGATVRVLEHRPLLKRAVIEKVIADNPQQLGDSDLHEAVELVKAQPTTLNLEEMSKLWSVFFQVPYALSVAYQCSYVIVEADVAARPSMPVTRPSIAPVPMGGPTIDSIETLEGAAFPIVWGKTLVLRGTGLAAHGLGLRVGTIDVGISQAKIDDATIELPLVQATFGGKELAAGVYTVRTVRPPAAGAPTHLERTSDSVPLVLRPSLSFAQNAVTVDNAQPGQPVSGKIEVAFSPEILADQNVKLFLDERVTQSPGSYVLGPQPPAGFPTAELDFAFKDVKPGTYLGRAQVDGVESAPTIEIDPDKPTYRQIIGPEVAIP